jgi:hypothetical protein
VRGTTGTGNNAGNAIGTCGLCEFGEQIRGAVRGYDPRLVLDAELIEVFGCVLLAPGYPKKASDYNAKPLKNLTLI